MSIQFHCDSPSFHLVDLPKRKEPDRLLSNLSGSYSAFQKWKRRDKSTRASTRRILQFNYCQVSGPGTRFIQGLARESCRYRKPRLVCSRREHGETGVPDAYSAWADSTVHHPARNRQRTVATQGNKMMCACAVSCSSSREETLRPLAGTRRTMGTQKENERAYIKVRIAEPSA